MTDVDPLTFLRTGSKVKNKCLYADVRDNLPAEVRDALLAVEDDADVSSARMLELINLHQPKAVGMTTIKAHRRGCPTCTKESQ